MTRDNERTNANFNKGRQYKLNIGLDLITFANNLSVVAQFISGFLLSQFEQTRFCCLWNEIWSGG